MAELIASEFFEQGDIEKRELNMKPNDVMDRENSAQLPRMQIEFIDAVCMPVYEVTLLDYREYPAGFVNFRQRYPVGKLSAGVVS